MKRFVLLGVIAFVVSLGGSTGLGLMLRHAPEEEIASDPAAEVEGNPIDESAPSAQPPEPGGTVQQAVRAVADEAEPVAEPALESAEVAPAVGPSVVEPTPAPIPEETAGESEEPRAVEYRQLAKILASMKPKEAAKILAYLSDEQADGILRSLGVREVAALLSAMPVERAATLSRQLLDQPREDR